MEPLELVEAYRPYYTKEGDKLKIVSGPTPRLLDSGETVFLKFEVDGVEQPLTDEDCMVFEKKPTTVKARLVCGAMESKEWSVMHPMPDN